MSIVHSHFDIGRGPARTGFLLLGTPAEDAELREHPAGLQASPLWLASILVATALATAANITGVVSGPASAALPLGIALIWLVASRPNVGCWLLLVGVPLTVGLGRNTIVPFLRPNEALVAIVSSALLIAHLAHPSRRRFMGLDIAITTFAAAGTLVPLSLLILGHTSLDVELWFTCLAPIQGLLVYIIFSRARLSHWDLRIAFHCLMAVSMLIALVGFAQLINVPGIRDFLVKYYSGAGETARYCTASNCRPTSLLEHYSSFGAFGMLNYAVALALLTVRHPGFPKPWLMSVMAVNALVALASQTQAAVVGIVLVTVLVLLNQRRVPSELGPMALVLVVGIILLWPQIHTRLEQQLTGTNASVTSPESLQTRILYWNQFFIPMLREHIWLGTGTLISTEVPARLSNYVDNEYIRLGFRAGIGGIALFFVMLGTIVSVGLRQSRQSDAWTRTLGLLSVVYVITLAAMGLTAEYFGFAGVSQQFWAVSGLLAASTVAIARTQRTSLLPAPATKRQLFVIRPGGQ
ncbi:MAG TPA: hypothetical protein DEV93_12590 [Chloroflexi bacterium]|jgi:hypothetical protein|nr:hypothetical protein [Chloroflexota bacterium]